MKSILFLTITLTYFCCQTQALIATKKNFSDVRYPGKCFVDGRILQPGEIVKHSTINCAQITCLDGEGLGVIETCEPMSILSSPLEKLNATDRSIVISCNWGFYKDVRATFPKCCERYINCLAFENNSVVKIIR